MHSKTIIILIITLLPLATFFLLFWQTNPSNIRLPTHIWPHAYNITIQPFMEEKDAELRYTFSGDVDIRIRSVIPTRYIVMHSRHLNYTSIEYWAENTPLLRRKIQKIRFELETERIMFEPVHNLNPNYFYIFQFKYTGLIRNVSNGVFMNEYEDATSKEPRWIVATQFQPNEARSAFPCFDEPQFKATFKISIIRPNHMKSYSNTRRVCSYMKGDFTVDTFKITPIMPVYTVAFVIAPYDQCTISADGHFAVSAKPEECKHTKYVYELGQKILTKLGDYFNMSYYEMGVDKLSLVSIANVNFNGMENWGLLVLLKGNILYDENSNSMLEKRAIALTLAHELSHMWFGNLVTCDWWNSIWLNEGFATYFSYFSLDMLENSQNNFDESFFEKVFRNSLSMDNGDIRPLNTENKMVSRDYFGGLIYLKGASIVHMIRHIIGDKNFQNFLRKYLRVNKYKTVTVDGLYNILREYCPLKLVGHLEAFLESFINQTSYPLVTINFLENTSSIEISQEGFPKAIANNLDFSTIYTVPISFTTDVEANFFNTAPAFFLFEEKKTFKLPPSNSQAKWLIVNIQSTWYYRVNYNKENWLRIGAALQARNWSGITVLNRAQIVDDIQHLFCIGKVSSNLALQILNYLSTEISYAPWRVARHYFRNVLRYSSLNQHEITILMQRLTDRVFSRLGFEANRTDDFSTLENRELITNLACKYGNPACLAKVKHYYKAPEELKNLPKNLQRLVYCTTAREGNTTVYEDIFYLYQKEINNEKKRLIVLALGCLKNPIIVEKHFWNILSPFVPEYEKLKALESLYSESDENAFQVYKLITQNYNYIAAVFGKETTVAEVLSKMSKNFAKHFQIQDLTNFSKMPNKINCKAALKIVNDAIEILNGNQKCF